MGSWQPPTRGGGVVFGSGDTGPTIQVTTTSPRLTIAHRRPILDGAPLSGEDLSRRLRVLTSERSEAVSVPVDGAEEPFDVWRGSDRWWAAGHHDGNGLMLEGTTGLDVEALSLRRVADIEPYLRGRRAQIRAARGEL
ncbi:hypothetical protein [Arthrobacter globiformis]|uniref:hypothetical protein n=1 Tax=Arthrobacter globiformis TaxID=1665 RepID=UPI0027D8404D|nr:hypothetical protein [Arthrobacter globiformis]